jgi:NADH-quinone oxidoreductase E subunit
MGHGISVVEAQPADLDLDGVRARMAPHQARVDELLRRYPVKRAALLQMLWLVQEEWGWVPRVAIKWCAEVCEVSMAHAFGVVEFYTMYRQAPMGRFSFKVCHTMGCHLEGAEDMIAHLEKRLSIKAGETTPDGLFSIERVECIAACGNAPAVQINDDFLYGPNGLNQLEPGWRPTPAVIDEWIEKLKQKAKDEPTPTSKVDEVGGIILGSDGHPGAVGAKSEPQVSGYAPIPPCLKVRTEGTGDPVTVLWFAAPECVTTELERSEDGGSTWRVVGSAAPKDVPGPPGPKTCKVEDKVAVGVTVSYRVQSVMADDRRRASAVIEFTATAAPEAADDAEKEGGA